MRAAVLAAIAIGWLLSSAAVAVPAAPSDDWIRIRSTGSEDKPYPALWFSTQSPMPETRFPNRLIQLPAAELAAVREVVVSQPCPGTTEDTQFELAEATPTELRILCTIGRTETCQLLARIRSKVTAPEGIDELRLRLACAEGARRR